MVRRQAERAVWGFPPLLRTERGFCVVVESDIESTAIILVEDGPDGSRGFSMSVVRTGFSGEG